MIMNDSETKRNVRMVKMELSKLSEEKIIELWNMYSASSDSHNFFIYKNAPLFFNTHFLNPYYAVQSVAKGKYNAEHKWLRLQTNCDENGEAVNSSTYSFNSINEKISGVNLNDLAKFLTFQGAFTLQTFTTKTLS